MALLVQAGHGYPVLAVCLLAATVQGHVLTHHLPMTAKVQGLLGSQSEVTWTSPAVLPKTNC